VVLFGMECRIVIPKAQMQLVLCHAEATFLITSHFGMIEEPGYRL
jgi:hypothetical protein